MSAAERERVEETLATSSSRNLRALAQMLHLPAQEDGFERLLENEQWRADFATQLVRYWRARATAQQR